MAEPIRVAVASGKGGTGKTTVAVNLAATVADFAATAYLDCDVEEPNGAIFLDPQIETNQPVTVWIPSVDAALCDGCGLCGQICRFSAIVPMGQSVLTFPELCHACGGCSYVCPTGAISEAEHPIGQVRTGQAGQVHFIDGLLKIGQAMAPPVIRAVKRQMPPVEIALLDAPPGTSCPAAETVRGADLVLLVTEPTPFGLHDLELAVEMIKQMQLPMAVVINRADQDGPTEAYCNQTGVEVLHRIPDRRSAAEAYSCGELLIQTDAELAESFLSLAWKVHSAVSAGREPVR